MEFVIKNNRVPFDATGEVLRRDFKKRYIGSRHSEGEEILFIPHHMGLTGIIITPVVRGDLTGQVLSWDTDSARSLTFRYIREVTIDSIKLTIV